jgi:hypothetical protein
MEQTQEDSYDKAVNSWSDAKIRYGQAWLYLKKAGEKCIYSAVWLLGIEILIKTLKCREIDDLSKSLPDSTKIIINLSQDITKILGDHPVVGSVLTAGLHNYAKDPQDGTKIVEQTWYVVKNCVVGTWDLGKAAYYLIDHQLGSESETSEDTHSDESPTLNGEEASLQTSE